MSDLKVTGKLIVKGDIQQVSERFKKREFVLEIYDEINGNTYTNYAKFQLTQAKCELLDRHNEGDTVEVSFNIKGNKWEKDGRVNFITNLEAWKVWGVSQGQSAPSGDSNNWNNPEPQTADDLPF